MAADPAQWSRRLAHDSTMFKTHRAALGGSQPADNIADGIDMDDADTFAALAHLKAGLGADPWFCDPQSPWQKGTVENTNNRIRKYLPRKTDPAAITDRYLTSICDRLNATPRKCLGYRTPAEVFREKLMEAIQSGE